MDDYFRDNPKAEDKILDYILKTYAQYLTDSDNYWWSFAIYCQMKWEVFHDFNVEVMLRGEANRQEQFQTLAYKSIVCDPVPKIDDRIDRNEEEEGEGEGEGEGDRKKDYELEPEDEYREEIDQRIEAEDEANFNPFYDDDEHHNRKTRKRMTAQMVLAHFIKNDFKKQLDLMEEEDEEAGEGLDEVTRHIKRQIVLGKIRFPPEMKNASSNEMIEYAKQQGY